MTVTNDRAADFAAPEDILAVLIELRDALRGALVAAGVDPTKTRATARDLDLDRNLVWRFARVANAPDMLAVIRDIPTSKQVDRLCVACRERGVEGEAIARVQRAVARFEVMVETSLGDRESLEILAAGLEHDDVTNRQENARRLAFQGNSAIWGVQAQVNFKISVTAPSRQDVDCIRNLRISGLVNLRRLRAVTWPILRAHGYHDDGQVMALKPTPIAPEPALGNDLPLLLDFCTSPLPEIRCRPTDYGRCYELVAGPIGNAGAATIVFADEFSPENPRYGNAVYRYMSSMIDLVTPSIHLVLDMYIHRDLEFDGPPEALLLDRLTTDRGYHPGQDDQHQLPLSLKPLRMGAGILGTGSHVFPSYPKLLASVMERSGLKPEEFVAYRLYMKYPPVPAAALLRLTYLDPPTK